MSWKRHGSVMSSVMNGKGLPLRLHCQGSWSVWPCVCLTSTISHGTLSLEEKRDDQVNTGCCSGSAAQVITRVAARQHRTSMEGGEASLVRNPPSLPLPSLYRKRTCHESVTSGRARPARSGA